MGFSRLFKVFSIATISTLSAVMVAVPAQATEPNLTVVPSQPALTIGSPSPQLELTSNARALGTPTEYLYVDIKTGGNLWQPSATCPEESSATSTLALCGITGLTITARDSNPVTIPSSITAFQSSRGVGLKFSPALDADIQGVVASRLRSFAVSLAPGAFTITGFEGIRTQGPINFNLEMRSTMGGGNNGVDAQGAGYAALGYKKYSFNANGGSGSMVDALLAPGVAISPSTYTKPGYNFAGWAVSQFAADAGYADFSDQAVLTSGGLEFSTFFAVWTAVGSSAPATTTAPATSPTTAPASTTPAATLATTGTSVSAWVPALALGLGWMLVAYSRSLRASRARHMKN